MQTFPSAATWAAVALTVGVAGCGRGLLGEPTAHPAHDALAPGSEDGAVVDAAPAPDTNAPDVRASDGPATEASRPDAPATEASRPDAPAIATAPRTVTFDPALVAAGNPSTGTVSLDGVAPPAGAEVTLTCDHPEAVQVPATVTVLAGAVEAHFPVTTVVVGSGPDNVAISASFHGVTQIGFLRVGGHPPANTATFDSTLRAPACRTLGSACDSGDLLAGRADLGPEKNSPNTIYGACQDGTNGVYPAARSIDGLRVSTVDGSWLEPGKTVRIEVTVHACNCSSGTSPDYFALYVARDATDPAWIPLNVLASTPAAGRQVLSATFTLPSGRLEAVRATISFSSFAEVCDSSGTSNANTQESDDLVFAVQNDGPDFVYAWPEAEGGVITKPLILGNDGQASAGKFVQVPAGRNSLGAPPADGHATLSFALPERRQYLVWGRAMSVSESEGSFWVRVDGGAFVAWDGIAVSNNWHWARVRDSAQGGQPLRLDLAAGDHKLELAYRKEGAQLDRLLITDDPLIDPAQESEMPGPPAAIADFKADAAPTGGVALSWFVDSYAAKETKVRRGTTPGGPYPVRFESNSPFSFDDRSVSKGTRYCYVARASNGAGDGPPSPELCVTP
jgi:hypothetical protein